MKIKITKADPKIAKAFASIMKNDLWLGFVMALPTIYVFYSVFCWKSVWQDSLLVGIFWASLALISITIVAELLNWRCPRCRLFLGMVYNPKFCPKCGVQLK